MKVEEPDDSATRPPIRSSAFSDENPFQSGSSPLAATEARRRSAVSGGDRKKSTSKRRKTTSVPSTEVSVHEQEDGIPVRSSQAFKIFPVEARGTRIKQEPDDGLEAGEEFSPEETLELVRERAKNGERDILPPRRKRPLRTSLVPRSAPWVILTSLLSGYALWFRQEKFAVGYCGVGRPSTALSNVQLLEWSSFLQPTCESCPPHAYCYESMETRCEKDFVLNPHPLSLNGILPIPPTCEPDGEKVRRVKVVADRAVEELRERNANWECGTLVDEKGKGIPTAEVDTQDLKSAVVRKRRKGMSEAEFEDLWKDAIGEIMTREDISSDGHLLRSTSLARLPLVCAFRRSIRLTLARYRLSIILFLGFCSVLAYIRSYIRALQSSNARIPSLVATTLDRLATQAALNARGEAPESWISVGQLRDDVLRDEFSASRRDKFWTKVAAVVERNANVRAAVREGRGGEVSRVWEWIGSVGMPRDGGRTESGRVSWGGASTPDGAVASPSEGYREMVEARKWDEGRPIY